MASATPPLTVRRMYWLGRSSAFHSLHRFKKFIDDLDQALAGGAGKSVGQHGRVLAKDSCVDVVPHGEYDFMTVNLPGNETVEFLLRPLLLQEGRTDYHYSVTGVRKALVDGSTQAVANPQRELIEPYANAPIF
ncbi:MAG: hypothetical protein OEY77_09400 [Nitrospira sp.]|nr:hypothetical protein [Nitrospira sp.]